MKQLAIVLGVGVTVASLAEGCTSDPSGPSPAPATDGGVDASSGSSGTTDGGGGADTGSSSGDGGGDCSGADPATVDGLGKILGGWRWSKDVSGGTEVDVSECDQRIGYFIGPDLAGPSYAQCAIARGEVIPLRGGNYASTATGCVDLTCSSTGLLMVGPKAAAVHALGPNGKPTGGAVFFFQIIPNATLSDVNLLQSNTASSANGKRMIRAAGVPSCK